MGIVERVKQDLRRDYITSIYASKNRYIPQAIYIELKGKRKCELCGENFKKRHGKKNTIDHIKPVCKGGESTRDNLRAICQECHWKLNEELEIEQNQKRAD